MAVDLIYKHQQKTYELMQEELKRSKRAAYEFPTGCGKTFPALKHIEDNPNKTVLIISPSTAINNQFRRYIETYVENGKERISNKNIAIVTYQKVALLAKKVKNLKADIIIIDELHRMGAETWEPAIDELIETQPKAEVIAMTATPRRTDKRNMAEEKFGDNIVYEMSLTEALSGEKEGEVVLKSPRYVRVLSQLMPQIKEYKENISYIEDEEKRQRLLKRYERLESIVSNSPDIQDVMVAGMQKKNGKYIVFCKNREDMMEKMAQAQEIFGKVNSNVHTEYVISKNEKGDTFGKSEAQNRRTLERFESTDRTDALQLLFCVDKLNEGVHIDGIDGEVLFDLTKSPVLYKQRIGRVTSPNGETVIIDAVNNWLNQIDTYYELENAIRKGQANGKDKETQDYDLFKLSPEETELLEILREIGEKLRYNESKTYEEMIKWLETHEGEMPRSSKVKAKEQTKEESEEHKLYVRWLYCKERKILEEYKGKLLEEVPESYREKIRVLREYGLGLTVYQEIIQWLEKNDGKMPRAAIYENRTPLPINRITKQEKNEINLYGRWRDCEERKILNEYEGRTIEEVPEEYREKIRVLREYGLGLKGKTTYEQIVEWLEIHDGEMPRKRISKNDRYLEISEMTEEEKEESNLRSRWNSCKERKILEEYTGKSLKEVPEEYREKISVLRELGLGVTIYEEIIKWLETNDGEMPRYSKVKAKEQTKKEKSLYNRWRKSNEIKILNKYEGKPIEEVPEEYRERIRVLREYGLGLKEKTIYEQIIEWLELNEGKLPRMSICKNGEYLKRAEMTEEEKEECNLRDRWYNCKERKILDEYAGRPIEEVPEEYREKIAKLRSLGQLGTKKDDKIKGRMKKAVGKAVGENGTTREELEEIKRS